MLLLILQFAVKGASPGVRAGHAAVGVGSKVSTNYWNNGVIKFCEGKKKNLLCHFLSNAHIV